MLPIWHGSIRIRPLHCNAIKSPKHCSSDIVRTWCRRGRSWQPWVLRKPARATPGVILHNSQCGRGRSARDTAAFRNPPTSWLAVRPRCRSASGLGTAPNPPSGLIARAMKQDDQCGTDRKVYEAGKIMHKMKDFSKRAMFQNHIFSDPLPYAGSRAGAVRGASWTVSNSLSSGTEAFVGHGGFRWA